LGLVASLNRPGANLTGSAILTAELAPKQLQLLRELVPNAAQFGVLSDPAFPGIHPTTRTGPDVASLRNEGSLFMRHVLIAFMLVMSISSDVLQTKLNCIGLISNMMVPQPQPP
jgi:hypothetical protein